ncbi:thiol reductant ABC exporter subunit CydD [Anaerobacillus arseniciselenatis]|uniref:Thiol reductant ABC exporter subunit CydD n=2 Tax=Anaerobacillus arseniciselenatis TaxID=85682 RepID=A0A1S2L772_9BACI|nr:thiol reductant ABC exporter subunit CydD [Anaerobacillus arseniciselenatis]
MNKRLNEEAKVKKVFAFLASFSTIGAVLAILQAYVIATIVDGVFLKDRGLSDVSILLGVLLFIFIGRGLLNYFTTKYGVKLASVVKMKLRNKLVEKLSSLQANQLYEEKTGKRVSVLTDAVDQLDAYYSSFLPQVFNAAVIPVMIVVVVFTQNIYSGLIMLITAPLIPVFMIIIGSMAEKKSKEQLNSMLRFSGHFLDVLQGIPMLKVFGQSKRQREKIIEMSNHFRDSTMDVLKIAFLSALMLEILATIATAMIAVEVGLRLVYGHLTFHTAFFVLLLAPELYMPLKNLGSSFHSGKNSISAAETIWEVLDKKETIPVWGSKKLNDVTKQTIKFENVSFQYNEKQQVLKNINVTINGRQRVAFVGKSGSGKTTLLKLLLGMLPPSEGQILINGVPLSELQEEQWLQSTAYVSQEPYIFSGTIKENIKVSNVNATDEEVYEAAKLAGVDRFVDDLPKRYDTSVGEAGIGLSGGEKQRIAVARAFLKKAAVVILDEPTAGLDLETESFLKEAIEKLCENATVLTVAHRLQTIVHSDQIVLLSEGEIVARGTHEQLLETSPLYQTIVSVYRGES